MLTSPIEEIKNRLDMVQVVGEYVKLQKAGANYRALCPFHSEKGPSFFVTPARQIWHCFGCGIGGSIFDFIMQIEGIEFGDALRMLAQKAGVELPKRDPAFAKLQSERKLLSEILDLASKFFVKQLESQQGAAVKEYLKGRGITEASLEAWALGYAPDSKGSLVSFLAQKGYKEQEIARAGLVIRTQDGTYDRFRSRIMFPIHSVQGEVVGFGGRIFGKDQKELAKYINTPATPMYDKSSILYGLDIAKLEIRKQDACILVEGYTDVINTTQTNTKNVVATSGTALTLTHLKLLKRYSDNLILAFDMDVAGDSATKRGIELALVEGFTIKIARLPEGQDPADIAKEDPAAWERAIGKASSLIDYYFESTFTLFDKTTPEGKKKAASLLFPVIAKLPSKIEQTHWVHRLAEELEVKDEAVLEELSKHKTEPIHQRAEKLVSGSIPSKKGRRELIEERILVLLFRDPENIKKLKEEDIAQMSLSTQEIVSGLQQAKDLEFSTLEPLFPAATIKEIQRLLLLADLKEEEEDLEDEFILCLKSLVVFSLKERLEEIVREIKKAEAAKESPKLELLLREFHEITKELQS